MEFFVDENDAVALRDPAAVERIAGLLDVASNELSEALLTRVIAASGQGRGRGGQRVRT